MAEQWFPAATRRPGPPSKHGYPGHPEPETKKGVVMHSMEGSLTAALRELDKLERRASWTFSNPKSGPLLQHYPVGYHTWASGSIEANFLYVSVEHEGKAGEPLTESQVDNDVGLLRWLRREHGWPAFRRKHELWEHREAVEEYGGGATACPSGRIPWPEILRRLQEDIMSDEQYRALTKLISECQGEANRQRAKITSDIKDLLNVTAAIARNLDQDHDDIKKAIADLSARF